MKDVPPVELVVVGGSAGSLDALSRILPPLPADFPAPIALVVHLPPDRDSVLVELLQNKCALRVCEARDKEMLHPGTAYLAPPDYHLLVEGGGYLSLSNEEPRMFSRPSIDLLFESAADALGPAVLGIVLSGANSDGAHGLRKIVSAGGRALVQSPSSAYATAMPAAAAAACPLAPNLRPAEMAAFLLQAVRP